MQPASDTDYKSLFSQLIKKQMLVLGPDITLAKVKNVIGITVDINGDVQKLEGDPQKLLQGLINQYVELSGMIVKKTMESILTSYPGMMAMATSATFGTGTQAATQPSPAVLVQTTSPVEITSSDSPIPADVTVTPNEPVVTPKDHPEPPSMADMQLESLSETANKKKDNPQGPISFTAQEMQDLNKALEDLSKAPLSTESPQQPAQPQA